MLNGQGLCWAFEPLKVYKLFQCGFENGYCLKVV